MATDGPHGARSAQNRSRSLALWLGATSPLLGAGCMQKIYDQIIKEFPPPGESSGSSGSTTESMTPTSGSESGTGTETDTDTETSSGSGESSGSSSTTTGELDSTGAQDDALPAIESFKVSPAHLGEAGAAALHLTVSRDVVAVRLSLDGDLLAELTPADFPYSWSALSAKDNGPARKFSVVVEDAEGRTAEAEATLSVLLPASGAEKCVFEDVDQGAALSSIAAIEYTPAEIVAVGARDTGAGLRMAAWKLDPDTCEVLGGWPRTISGWTAEAALGGLGSVATAVDVDEDGNVVIAGRLMVAGGDSQSYVALLNPGGSRLWEQVGEVGDEVSGVAAAKGAAKDRVFVVGSRRTGKNPVRTDAAIWVYQLTNGEVFVPTPVVLRAPFNAEEFDKDMGNMRSEWARAVVVHPGTGHALVVGEREIRTDIMNQYTRSFTVRVDSFGQIVDAPWTSNAPSQVNDAARSVATCGDTVLAGGWTREDEGNAESHPLMLWIREDGTLAEHRAELQLDSIEIFGIACDREGKVVSAGTKADVQTDARVFAVPGPFGALTSYEAGLAGNDAATSAACDARGFCGWGGFRSQNGKTFAVVRVHHP